MKFNESLFGKKRVQLTLNLQQKYLYEFILINYLYEISFTISFKRLKTKLIEGKANTKIFSRNNNFNNISNFINIFL